MGIQGTDSDGDGYTNLVEINARTFPGDPASHPALPVNTAPVANSQTVSTSEGTAKAITLIAFDANSDVLTYSVVSNPAHGVLSGTAPALTYTPNAGYNGSDSFIFKVNDGKSDSNIATVSITVTAAIPPPTSVLTTIKVSPARIRLAVGSTQVFTAVTLDQFNNPVDATVTWTSSNPDVGTIDAISGVFTASTVTGTTTITATSSLIKGTASVKVIVPKGRKIVWYQPMKVLQEIEDSNED